MKPTLRFVVINLSDEPVDEVLPGIRAALDEQLNGTFADAHGGMYEIRIGSSADRKPDEVAINLRPSLPEAPEALGYHYVMRGIPDIEIGLDSVEGYVTGSQSLAVVMSHEIIETIGDRGANEWVDRGDGTMRARELCDCVEDTTYAMCNGVDVSNFLLPSAFIRHSDGPWDYLGVLNGPNGLTAGGYDIEAAMPSAISQVTSMKHLGFGAAIHHGRIIRASGLVAEAGSKKHKRKSSPFSRTYRRGIRL